MWRKKILPFFLFNRKERRGIYILLMIITGMWMIPWFFSSQVSSITVDELIMLEQASDTVLARGNSTKKVKPDFSPQSLFFFDPNTASEADWKQLGLPDKTIRTLMKYLSKGGRIRKPEDLQKIFGFPEDAYKKLGPFVKIKEDHAADKKTAPGKFQDRQPYISKPKLIQRVFINQADSTQWEALPGIGPRLASRIILFRTKLGGFISVQQVSETYGLPDSTFQKIKPFLDADNPGSPNTLDINLASQEELQAHPYLNYQMAKLIIAYRNQHGPFKQKEEIRKIALMTPELFLRLSPYIEAN
ncbi:MAG: ComEA family DNA-binding protein [Chitinophagaceae bacterium]